MRITDTFLFLQRSWITWKRSCRICNTPHHLNHVWHLLSVESVVCSVWVGQSSLWTSEKKGAQLKQGLHYYKFKFLLSVFNLCSCSSHERYFDPSATWGQSWKCPGLERGSFWMFTSPARREWHCCCLGEALILQWPVRDFDPAVHYTGTMGVCLLPKRWRLPLVWQRLLWQAEFAVEIWCRGQVLDPDFCGIPHFWTWNVYLERSPSSWCVQDWPEGSYRSWLCDHRGLSLVSWRRWFLYLQWNVLGVCS